MKDKIKKNLKYIVIAVVLLFIATFIYNYVNEKDPVGVEEQVYETNVDQEAQEILETLDAVSKIKIDNTFFSQSIISEEGNLISFFNLVDFSLEDLPEKPFGKENPFLEGSSIIAGTPVVQNEDGVVTEGDKSGEVKLGDGEGSLTDEEKEAIKNSY